MAIPDGVTKLVISGTLGTGKEKWACSIWLDGYTAGSGSGSIDLDALDTNAQWVAFRGYLLAGMSPNDAFTNYDSYWYQGNVAVAHKTKVVNYAGSNSTITHPFQIAAVMTLRTALATRSGRGRLYLPMHCVPITFDGAVTGSALNNAGNALAAWMSTFAISTPEITPVVVSQTHGLKTAITSVDWDAILDTQRRRRNRLTSARTSAAVTQH